MGAIKDKIKIILRKCILSDEEYNRFRKTEIFQLIRAYRYDRFISKDVKKGDYSALSKKRMHYTLDKRGLLTDSNKEILLRKMFKAEHGYDIDFKDPKTFSEKIMWLKLYYQNPLITKCCDKFAVKEYVTDMVGEEYVVPTINSWTNPSHINFDELPDRFAIKVNWASGYLKIVKNKSKLDYEQLREQIREWMTPYRNSYYQSFNWGYKNMPPMIFAEEYIEQKGGQVYDYKFFCMNGKVTNVLVVADRHDKKSQTVKAFYDRDFNFLGFIRGEDPNTIVNIEKPKNFEKMIELAEKLSIPFPFVRVDFYEIEDRVYVGEMTFYPGGGLLPFKPKSWDDKLGEMLKLPNKLTQNEEEYYDKITPKECFMMEKSITPNMKKNFCLQKAYKQMGYLPNLENPASLNEKIIWLALNYKNPLIKKCAEKYDVKEFIAEKIGSEYVVPTYGIYDDVTDIKPEDLPEKFVCKSTAGWGGNEVIIVDDKKTCCFDYLKVRMTNWLYPWASYYYQNMCITDEKIMPRIIIEEFLEAENGLNDYKIYCCNGKASFALVVSDRDNRDQTRTYVDLNWNCIPVYRKGKKTAEVPDCPEYLSKMIELSEKLSEGFPFVRVDLYEVDGRIYVGEMTFTPGMFLGFRPIEMDYKLGNLLDLSEYIN